MADKSHYNPFADGAPGHHPSWTDGLPHDFKGWGPQTPDPDDDHLRAPASETEHIRLRDPEGELIWRGKGDRTEHIVWRFEPRKH